MKKLLIICGLLFSVVTFANAQQGGGQRRQMTPEDRVKMLDEKVKLTDEQKTKATEVYTAAAAEQKKMRDEAMASGGTVDRDAMMAKFQKMQADVDTKITGILTDTQKTAYKAWQDEMKAAREKAMKERQAGGNQ